MASRTPFTYTTRKLVYNHSMVTPISQSACLEPNGNRIPGARGGRRHCQHLVRLPHCVRQLSGHRGRIDTRLQVHLGRLKWLAQAPEWDPALCNRYHSRICVCIGPSMHCMCIFTSSVVYCCYSMLWVHKDYSLIAYTSACRQSLQSSKGTAPIQLDALQARVPAVPVHHGQVKAGRVPHAHLNQHRVHLLSSTPRCESGVLTATLQPVGNPHCHASTHGNCSCRYTGQMYRLPSIS